MIREINPHSSQEITLVAQRMRQTLIDVLGEEKGSALYTMDWLLDRVKWHLDPKSTRAKVLLSENSDRVITGQAIARIEHTPEGKPFGYFSTLYVAPEFRRQGIANALLKEVEKWFVELKMEKIVYNTAENNSRVHELFITQGYQITATESEMVQLTKLL